VTSLTLVEKIAALHACLEQAELAHAFGGALALAYCTLEPRGTRDIDVNVFITPKERARLEASLPGAVEVDDANRLQLDRDGQSRLWWDDTPVDVFLSNHPFHDQAKANRRFVPFAEIEELPVLACSDLAIFKAFFGRPKDAIDIGAMAAAKAIDLAQVERDAARLLGDRDQRADFFALARSSATG